MKTDVERIAKEYAHAYELGFLQGAEYGRTANKWISIKEQKPAIMEDDTISEWLFVKTANGERLVGHMFKDGRFTSAHTGVEIHNVTHWMYQD